ncbi:VapC toxin family PIN domain ribonuclease [Streptomyces violaceus]|uniref:VapC toxin family PIN domain ribonuclease n=1 Tax=Streptomyces violaceus TaxID=1936 RepID=UPI00399D5B31
MWPGRGSHSTSGDPVRSARSSATVYGEVRRIHTEDHLGAARSVRVRCRALGLDLADAVNVALATDDDTDAILTLDRRDFRAVRPLGRYGAFRELPDDLPL